MVRQVPRYEAGIKVVEHALQGRFRIDAAMGAGHLPHAVQETTDAQIGGELHLAFYGYGHISLLLLALVYADCGKQTVLCLPHPNKRVPREPPERETERSDREIRQRQSPHPPPLSLSLSLSHCSVSLSVLLPFSFT